MRTISPKNWKGIVKSLDGTTYECNSYREYNVVINRLEDDCMLIEGRIFIDGKLRQINTIGEVDIYDDSEPKREETHFVQENHEDALQKSKIRLLETEARLKEALAESTPERIRQRRVNDLLNSYHIGMSDEESREYKAQWRKLDGITKQDIEDAMP